ncbi:MAG: class I SAM-dependent methyltransferase [Armatimonadota bacterium]|nr:class I SAM-dependent methyltransferase [Armatimonadota bacterium]MDR7463436.1 class I SAM-dependent methyltransferase [Armatimonadota bacterium]MDR7539000.1 class I SAM-dependent methyltransferase [Armatimonadota bacterium]
MWQGGRLVQYGRAPDKDYWTKLWAQVDREELLAGSREDLVLLAAFRRHLPREGRILEAGCGLGQWVQVLREEGFYIEGVDWSIATIELLRRSVPHLPVWYGDVRQLPVPDGHYQAVIALGVVEHFPEGPAAVLREFVRILAAGGVLILSVPYVSPLRRLKAAVGWYRPTLPVAQVFYQYAFRLEEMDELLAAVGLHIEAHIPYDAVLGLRTEVGIVNALYRWTCKQGRGSRSQPRGRRKRPWARILHAASRLGLMRHLAGHMMLYVARR